MPLPVSPSVLSPPRCLPGFSLSIRPQLIDSRLCHWWSPGTRETHSWWPVPCLPEQCPSYLCVRLELFHRHGLAEKWASSVTGLGAIVTQRVEVVTQGFGIGCQAWIPLGTLPCTTLPCLRAILSPVLLCQALPSECDPQSSSSDVPWRFLAFCHSGLG